MKLTLHIYFDEINGKYGASTTAGIGSPAYFPVCTLAVDVPIPAVNLQTAKLSFLHAENERTVAAAQESIAAAQKRLDEMKAQEVAA